METLTKAGPFRAGNGFCSAVYDRRPDSFPQTRRSETAATTKVAGLPHFIGPCLLPPMARIPLEDNFTDVIRKAQRGRKIPDKDLIALTGVTPADLAAVKA